MSNDSARGIFAAREVAEAAKRTFSEPVTPRMMSAGGHVIFRMDPLPIIGRVGLIEDEYGLDFAITELKFSRALEPTAVINLPDDPFVSSCAVVTFHPLILGRPPVASTDDLVAVSSALKGLHKRLRALECDMPVFTEEIEKLRAAVAGIGPHAAMLLDKIDAGAEQLCGNANGLQPVHGDANLGNVVIVENGEAVWLDFECVCRAPLEWDVALLPAACSDFFDVDPGRLALCRVIRDRMFDAWSLVHPVRWRSAS